MYTASIQGINQNTDLMNRYARDLQNIDKADIAGDMVGMMLAEKGVGANVAALKAANEMHEHIIDILV